MIAAMFSPANPSEARDMRSLYNAARLGSGAPQHSRGTACRARSRHPLNSAIEGSFVSARLALVILSGAKDLNCQ
jgi:hypothetical protein